MKKFTNISEAFNAYKGSTIQEIEKRAQAIGQAISDPAADIASLNIELDGLKEAKANIEQRSQAQTKLAGFNPVTGMNFQQQTTIPQGSEIFATKEYRSSFLKTMLGQPLNDGERAVYKRAMEQQQIERRADAFSTTTNSAAILPTTTLNEIISKARTLGGLMAVCRGFNIPSNLSVPVATPSGKAAWHYPQGAPVESEKASVANISFAANEILKVFSISVAAKTMSIDSFESYLTTELSECVMATIADSLVNGTGETGQGTGILPGITWNAANSLTFAKGGNPTFANLTSLAALLKRGYGAGASWAVNNATLFNQLYGLTDTTDRPLFLQNPQTDGVSYLLGRPVIVDDNLPDKTIIFGNFAYMSYNLANGIMVEVSRESSFKSGLVDYRGMAIADTKPVVTEAFVKLTEALA